MNFAIIAAGEGSRLAQEGVSMPKPLVPLRGVPMIDRLLEIFVGLNAGCIAVIVNPNMKDVVEHVSQWKERHADVDFRVAVQQTPSSMHSFGVLSDLLPAGKFILTTVDTIFDPEEFRLYVDRFESADSEATEVDGMFAVTTFVDDEKPLWISFDDDMMITEFSDTAGVAVSGGIYGLHTESALPVLHKCLDSGQARMRNYQRALLADGLKIKACVFDRIFDIDHASDIEKAEQWCC
ncbi:MAG: NTP transferase domain-containing protein [Bacteroidales bacterium]|nr:NTP transferase domain-containing protein [Candidatus Liminaster caballi]